MLVARDARALKRFLSPAFRATRAGGGVQRKATYLADLPKVKSFTIRHLRGRVALGVLVVSYELRAVERVNGAVKPVGPQPELTVFAWQHGSWRLLEHADADPASKTR